MTALGGASDVPGTRNRVDIENLTRVDEHNKKENDDNNIQIIISSNPNEQTTIEVTSAVASPQDENQGVNEMTPVDQSTSAAVSLQDENQGVNETTPVDQSSLKIDLQVYVLLDMWDAAKSIFDEFPDMVRIPLTVSGDTALHVAVRRNSITCVEGLVKLMSQEELKIPNSDGNTTFCMAAISGNGDFIQIMIEKNENLPMIRGHDGMLPVHLAALTGHHKIVQDLSSKNLLDKMASNFEDIERLFFMTISNSMFDVATKLFEEYSDRLAIARYDKECRTALHMLARKPSEEMYMKEDNNEGGAGLQLLKNLWSHVRKLENHFLHLITHPSVVIFDAVKSGNNGAVKYILYTNRQLLTIKDVRGQNVLHYAVLYRNRNIFYFILLMETRNLVLLAVDNDRNNVLHLAAHRNCQHEELSSLRPTTQMKRQLEWFKEVEKRVPPELRTMRNNQGKIPIDVFYDEHKKLSEEIKASAKGIAESGMLVATLVATVAFAAALTVPGDKTNVWFIVFILTNAVALFASSASILSFLSNFTSSRFADSKFATSLHPSLILGPTLLIISTVAMVIAFVAASFLIFDHTSKWVAYVVASMGVFPILLFLLFQFSRFDDFLWSRCYRLSKVQ